MIETIFSIVVSYHLNFNHDYNAIHPHIRFKNENYIVGSYYGSESKLNAYAGIDKEFYEVGLVTGYKDPMPFIRLKYSNFFLTPGVEDDTHYGLVIGYEHIF